MQGKHLLNISRQCGCASEVSETGKFGVFHLCSSSSPKTFSVGDETQKFQGQFLKLQVLIGQDKVTLTAKGTVIGSLELHSQFSRIVWLILERKVRQNIF